MKKHLLLIFVLTMLFGIGAYGQSNCAAPTGLTASLHNPQWNNVLLNWDAVTDSTQLDIMWSTTTMYTRIGTNGGADFIGTVRFTPTELADQTGRYLSSVTFVPGESQDICTYSVVVWQGGSQVDDTTFNAGTMLVNQEITSPLTINALNTVLLDTAVSIDVTQELWIGIRCVYDTTAHPLGASNNGVVTGMGELLYIDGEWETLSGSNLTDYNWLIIGHLQDPENMITGYNLYRDNALLSTLNATSFIDTLEEGTYQYDLTVSYFNSCESDPVSVSVTMTDYPCDDCQDTVIVGNGTTTTYYVPLNTYYKYSFSEQIYTANELSDISGRINCISFQYIYSTDQEKDIVVYMGNTNKSSFSGGSDWVPVSQMVPVFQGVLNFTNSGEGNWVNIPLNTPFEYDGNSNIVVAVLNNTGSYLNSSPTFNVHSASGKTLYLQNDSNPYDVNNLSSGSTYSNRNNIRFLIGEPVTCPMPGMLTISDITSDGATASWHSNEAHSGYELVIVPEGESMENQTTVTANDTFYVFENLADNTTYSVYLRAICFGDNSSWIFPVSFTTDPLCTSPEHLTVSQIAGTSALITWEPAPVGATSYTVAYTEAGQENWVTETVSGYHYLLSGLEPQTAYEVTVTSVCNEGSAPAISKTFTTHCLAGGEIPIGDGTGTSTSIPSYSFYNYGYSQQIFTAAEIGGPTDITSISVNMANLSQQRNYKIYLAHTTETSLSSGWASTTGAQLVFSSPQTLTTGWNTFDFTTPFNYNGTDNLLVIFIDSTGSYVSGNSWYTHSTTSSLARYMYQDSSVYPLEPTSSTSGTSLSVRNNIRLGGECDETATCIAPNVIVSNITSESVTIEWVPGYTEQSWEIEYCTDTANWISEGTATTSPYTISNLTANTLYSFRIRSVCGGGEYSNWRTMQARTECDAIAVLPYSEDFDSYGTGTTVYPSCWGSINTYTSGTYPYITSTNYAGTGSLYFYAGTSGTANIAIVPPFSDEIPVNTLQANFMYRASYSTDMLIVGVMTDPNIEGTFVAIDTVYPATTASDWTEQRVTFDQYTGEGRYIAFKNQYTTTYTYAYIDNLVIDEMEACPQPMHVVATSTPSDTVYLTWDAASGSLWDVIYGPVGFDPDDEEEESAVLIQGVTDNPLTISGLAGGMGYDFYVRTDCGSDGLSIWSTYPASAYPYSYAIGINGSDTVTGCGFNITDDGGPDGNYSNNCDYTLVIYPSDPDSIVTVSGTFAGEGTLDYLSIYNGVGVDANELIQKITSGTSGTVINFGPLVSESGPITLYFHSDGSVVYPGFVAIVSCIERPTCPRPNHFNVTGSTSNSVDLEWIASGSETTWNIEYGPTGFTQGTGTVEATTTNPYTVNNLTSGTTYDFYVQADCGSGDVSDWTGPVTGTPGSYNMPVTGNNTITACDLVVYDDGGVNGNYSNYCDSYLTINPETPGNLVSIQGTLSTESCCDYLRIFDGPDANGTMFGEYKGENMTIPELTSTTGPITLYFHSDLSVVKSGFELTVSCISNTCPKPTNLAVSNVGENTADLSWTPGGSEASWIVEYKEATAATWITATATSTSYQLTGLTGLTSYNVRVKADCGDETSQYATASFTTPACAASDACQYTFVLGDGYGDGWNDGYLTVEQNGIIVATLEAVDQELSNIQTYDTVTVNLCDGNATTLVWHSGNYDDEISITLFGPDNTQLFTVDDLEENYASPLFTFTTDCSGAGPVITNPTVATNAASAIEQTTATLNATITNPDNVTITAKGFEWKVNTPTGTYTQIAGTGTGNAFTANLTGLTANTGYTFKAFITYNGQTVYGSEMTFTTLEQGVEPCDVPTGLTAGDITSESIAISWNANANAEGYNIQYSPQGGSISSASTTTNSYTITGLTPNTTYQIQVQSNCGNSNLSGWSEPITVTTTGIDNYLLNSITLYPNPAKDVVNVQSTMNNVQLKGIEVIDVYGKVVRTVVETMCTSSLQTQINVSGLAAGMYFVRVTTEQGVATKTFVKK